jgi:hypothetical protein
VRIFYSLVVLFFLQSSLVRTCVHEEKIIINEAKTIELAKKLKIEASTIKNRFSALNSIKNNTSLKKYIDFFSEIIDLVVINKDDNSMVPFFNNVIDEIMKNPRRGLLKSTISKKYKLKKELNDNELLVLLNGKKIHIIQYNSTQLNTIYFIFSDIYATKMLKDIKKSIGNNVQNLRILKKISDERGIKI